MPTDSIADSDRIVHEPSREFVESTNVWEFMQMYDIDDYEELVERTTSDVDGVESGVDWFWDELVDYLDVEFYEEYDTVRDRSRGPQFDDWYKGGKSTSRTTSSTATPPSTRRPATRSPPSGRGRMATSER